MKLEHFAQMRALEAAYISTNAALTDAVLNDPEAREKSSLKLKRIQFDAWEGLASELDRVCGLLECSKRQFLEGAVSEALDRAEAAYVETLNKVAADRSGAQVTLIAEGR